MLSSILQMTYDKLALFGATGPLLWNDFVVCLLVQVKVNGFRGLASAIAFMALLSSISSRSCINWTSNLTYEAPLVQQARCMTSVGDSPVENFVSDPFITRSEYLPDAPSLSNRYRRKHP